jgi:adenosylcobinamide-phosphate synthase
MAGALNVQLAGPRVYSGVVVMEPMINGSRPRYRDRRISRAAYRSFYASCSVLTSLF